MHKQKASVKEISIKVVAFLPARCYNIFVPQEGVDKKDDGNAVYIPKWAGQPRLRLCGCERIDLRRMKV